MATIILPPIQTSPMDDAITLHDAFMSVHHLYGDLLEVGRANAAVVVVNILAHRDATQRAFIQQAYKAEYSEDILKRLSLVLSDDLKEPVLLWMPDPVERDAIVVHQGLNSDLKAATEVICSRTPSEIQSFKQQYHSRFEVPLEDDIKMKASGDHKALLLGYVSTLRDEGPESDRVRAEEDSRALWGTDKRAFINIFSERSRAQLAAVISAYHDLYGNSLEMAVKGKNWGLFGDALCTILSCSENPARYFAEVLRKAMKGLGTDETTLTRAIVTRTEIDMQYIKAEYLRKYNKTLRDAVHSETSGHYRTFLLSLLGPNH